MRVHERGCLAAVLLVMLATGPAAGEGHPLSVETRADLRQTLAAQELALTESIATRPTDVDLYSQRGDVRTFLGQFGAALADYDRMIELQPDVEGSHWRRGIALFYAGQYPAAARQFERYHSFDNVDRENGIWRFLSQLKADGAEAAQAGLLQYEKDDREPFPDVYRLFAGTITPTDALERIASADVSDNEREKRLFYAHLYIGLLHAVRNQTNEALPHLRKAVVNDWAQSAGYGPRYMWHVGRLQYEQLAAASVENSRETTGDQTSLRTPAAITPPPDSLQLDSFYRKCLLIEGFPVIASQKVHDAAVHEAAFIVTSMLQHRPDLLEALRASGTRLVVMAHNELTTDIPEHSDLTPRDYWDRRARGLGATKVRPAVSCGEENLLQFPGDPYSTENILVHEFAHAIHEMGLNRIDTEFDDRLQTTFEQAGQDGLWRGTYALTNLNEYWAEGVQSYFDTNRENDGQHNHVNTRAELKEHDPRLFALIDEVFVQNDWRYVWPRERDESVRSHLVGYDPGQAPTFRWPDRLKDVNLNPRRQP